MRRALPIAASLLLAAAGAAARASFSPPAQEVVDRIAVRIEDDIITLSEIRELAAYQQLVDGRSEPENRLQSELIEQWVVNHEASASRFPEPAESEVNREVARIGGLFPTPQAYQERLAALGLTPESVRRVVTRQIYLARYLDYKFRPAVQVDDADIAKYYKEQLVPALAARSQPAPPLEKVSDQILEVLVEQRINDRAASWFDETRSRLKIEVGLPADAPSGEKR
jgi:hypothetical protein